MVDDLPWVMAAAFVAWLALGRAYGLRKGVRVGFIAYAVAAFVLGALKPLLAFMLLVVTPFAAIAALAGVWLGDRSRPGSTE